MEQQRFEWDDFKAEVNFRKHGVAFEEAITVFDDPFYLEDYDESHSEEEDRFKAIGESSDRRLSSSFTLNEALELRIISTRLASKNERKYYDAQS